MSAFDCPRPPIGMPIQWLPNGNINEKPHAANVTDINTHGTIRLQISYRNGSIGNKSSVMHIDDPKLLSTGEEFRAENGAWRYIPGVEPRGVPETNNEHRICDLNRKSKSSSEIAEIMGEQWTHQKVTGVLRKYDQLVGTTPPPTSGIAVASGVK